MVAGGTATITTYPLEFLRTRYAMEKGKFQYMSYRSTIYQIYQKETLATFYSGLSVALIVIYKFLT